MSRSQHLFGDNEKDRIEEKDMDKECRVALTEVLTDETMGINA